VCELVWCPVLEYVFYIVLTVSIQQQQMNVDTTGWTELHKAVERADVTEIERLLANVENSVDAITTKAQWCRDVTFVACSTPLHIAAALDDLRIVRLLVERFGARVDAQDVGQRTPVYLASWLGHVRVVEFLCWRGADVNKAKNYGATPLHKSVMIKSVDDCVAMIDVLCAFGADCEARDVARMTPIMDAVLGDRLDAVRRMLEFNASIEKFGADDDWIVSKTTKVAELRALLLQQQTTPLHEREARRASALTRVRRELSIRLMRFAQPEIVDICIALASRKLPPYVLLWIIDWLPNYDRLSHHKKIQKKALLKAVKMRAVVAVVSLLVVVVVINSASTVGCWWWWCCGGCGGGGGGGGLCC
jgi:hypothetical protein